jgi:cytidine deaminase
MQEEKSFQFTYRILNHWNALNENDQNLVKSAFAAMENAYAPYSKFKVGAAALLENQEVICGSNQENIAYPSGLCAERVALNYAGAAFPGVAVRVLCIVAKGDLMPMDQLLSPCGGCRQVMLESENRQKTPIRILMVNQDGSTMILDKVQDLLPFGFGSFH